MHSNDPQDFGLRNYFYGSLLFIIFFTLACGLLFCTGCDSIPGISDDIEKMVDNDAINITCDKDCFQKDTDVEISVKVTNKENQVK